MSTITMKELLEAGVHFGHQAHRWNPKMGSYIFGTRNNIHIIDLAQSVPMLHRALQAVSDTVAKGGRILFVGTKRQAQDAIAEAAKKSAQYYVNSRWLGGTLTNWKTVSNSSPLAPCTVITHPGEPAAAADEHGHEGGPTDPCLGTVDKADLEKIMPTKPPYSPYAGRNFPTRPLFGDTHLHTGYSMDAGAFGAKLGPRDAYKFARGEEILSSTGQPVKLSRPLDFLVVSDHSEMYGLMPQLIGGGMVGLTLGLALAVAERIRRGVEAARTRLPGGAEVQVTVSLGVSSHPDHGDDSEALIRAADELVKDHFISDATWARFNFLASTRLSVTTGCVEMPLRPGKALLCGPVCPHTFSCQPA